jgi:hypothetical protein
MRNGRINPRGSVHQEKTGITITSARSAWSLIFAIDGDSGTVYVWGLSVTVGPSFPEQLDDVNGKTSC